MNEELDKLIKKLLLLGNRVKRLSENRFIVTNNMTRKRRIAIGEGRRGFLSDEYDDIQPLEGSDYFLVRVDNAYGFVYKTNKLNAGQTYESLEKAVMTSNGVYAAIAMLKEGLTGVVDTHDNVLIPFYHNKIDLFETKHGWVYVGHTWDHTKVYNDRGGIYKVTSIVGLRNLIIGYDKVCIFSNNSNYLSKAIISSLDGKVMKILDDVVLMYEGNNAEIWDSSKTRRLERVKLADYY